MNTSAQNYRRSISNLAAVLLIVTAIVTLPVGATAQEQNSQVSMLPTLDRDAIPLPSDARGHDSTIQLLESLHKRYIHPKDVGEDVAERITIGPVNLADRANQWMSRPVPSERRQFKTPDQQSDQAKPMLDRQVIVRAIRIKGLRDQDTPATPVVNLRQKSKSTSEIVRSIKLQKLTIPTDVGRRLHQLVSHQADVNLDLNCAYATESNAHTVQTWIDRVFGKRSDHAVTSSAEIARRINLKAGEDSNEIIQSMSTMFDQTYPIDLGSKQLRLETGSDSQKESFVFDMIKQHSARVIREDAEVFSLDSENIFSVQASDSSIDVTTDAIRRLSEYQRGVHPDRSLAPTLDEVSEMDHRSSAVPLATGRNRTQKGYSVTNIVIVCVWVSVILWIVYGAILARPAQD